MSVEQFDQLGEVGERARQPVDLVDDDHVDPVSANVVEQPLERRPLHRAAGIAAIVVTSPDQFPAFMGLALDVGLRRLPLPVFPRGRLGGSPEKVLSGAGLKAGKSHRIGNDVSLVEWTPQG